MPSEFSSVVGRVSTKLWMVFPVCVGAAYGTLFMPEPRAIDGALVLSGLVSYPQGAAQGIYYHNMWTAAHQFLGLLIQIGLSPDLVSHLFRMALGAAFLAGPALCIVALTRSIVLAVGVPPGIVLAEFYLRPPDYPILFASSHSYGQLALTLAVLSIGLYGTARYRQAGIVAGALPAVHPVVGAWAVAILVAGSWLYRRMSGEASRGLASGILLGLALTGVSFAVFWAQRVPVAAPVDADTLRLFVANWDYHRQVPYTSRATILCLAATLLWLTTLIIARRERSLAAMRIATTLSVSTVVSWGLYEALHRFPGIVPAEMVRWMPGRLVNVHFLLALPVMLAVCVRFRWLFLVVAVALLACFVEPKYFSRLFIAMGGASIILSGFVLLSGSRIGRVPKALAPSRLRGLESVVLSAVTASLSAVAALGALHEARPPCSNDRIDDCRAPEVYTALRGMSVAGVVAAPAGIAMMVHRHANKPVLLGASGFDFVPYLPRLALQVRQILEDVYGLDFENPPERYRNQGNLLQGMGRDHWSRLTAQGWRGLGLRYCIGAVVAPSDWVLQLDPALRRDGVALYLLEPPLRADCEGTLVGAAMTSTRMEP